jgi:hypothetical protein
LCDESGDAFLGRCERAGGRRAAADSSKLGADPLGPERCADPVEDGERLLKRHACLSPTLDATLRDAEGEKRASTVEGKVELRMPLERLPVCGESVVELSGSGGEKTPAARGRGQCRHALEAPGVPLVPVEVLASFVETPQLNERLDLIDHERDRPRLDY